MIGRMFRESVLMIVALTIVTGLAYPVLITGIALGIFSDQARGSMVMLDGKAVGSALIGQSFSDPGHFWGRLSASAPQPYNAVASGGSNQGPLDAALLDKVKAAAQTLRDADPQNTALIPVDLVTASASGLDPDISLAAAYYQAGRIARVRKLPLQRVKDLIVASTTGATTTFIGEPRVNVLRLNLALDRER